MVDVISIYTGVIHGHGHLAKGGPIFIFALGGVAKIHSRGDSTT